MGGHGHWRGRGNRAGGRRAGPAVGAGVGVPTATLVTDGHCVDGRDPGEWVAEVGTWIWWVKQAEFGSLGAF